MKNKKNISGVTLHGDCRHAFDTQGKKWLPFWMTVMVIMVLAVGGLCQSCRRPPESVDAKEKVSLGISKSFLSIPVYIAKEQGFFATEGLEMTVREYTSGKLATKGMFAGEVDMATVADIPVVFNSFKRQDFCVFATFTSSYHFVKIIARQDKGIKTGADLKGKKVGANRGTTSHFFLGAFLTNSLVAMTDVEMVHTKTVDLPDALINNEVDAISVWQPYAEKTRRALADNAIELPSPEIYRATFSFAAKEGFVKDRRHTVEKFLRAMGKAATFIQENREESQAIIARNFNIEKEIVSRLWDDYTFGIFLDQALLYGLDDVARWAIENRFTDKEEIVNFFDYLCPDVLDAVKPVAVTIIR